MSNHLIDIIRSHGLEPKKNLGQHFLLDQHLLARIAQAAGPLSHAHVIEVGPGPGGLTQALLDEKPKHLTVIEKDSRCLAALKRFKEITIVEGDALAQDITQLVSAPRIIVSNLPYNIGTELFAGWLECIYCEPQSIDSMTLMFQKEVASRITAEAGSKDRGRLSVLTEWLCETETIMDIPAGAFYPPPKVTSTLIKIYPRRNHNKDVNIFAMKTMLSAAFHQRRKMLRSSLRPLKDNAEELILGAGVAPTKRPEELTLEEWVALIKKFN